MENYGRLLLISPDGTEQVFPLTASVITLGRDENNDIVLADQKVSRQHAQLECSDQGCILIDNGSANGTFVDRQRCERVILRSGNLIELGNSTLRFEQDPPVLSSERPAGRVEQAGPSQGSSDRHLLDQFLDNVIDGFVDELEPENLELAPSNQTASLRYDRLLRTPHLVVYTAQKTWRVRLREQESWTIGRDPDNDIVIEHPKVSRQHARIERRSSAFIIHDLDSGNGTYLGQQRIQVHRLRHTDTLNIGPAQLVFKDVNSIDQRIEGFVKKAERLPVIVVPGNFGSTLWRGSEKIWPSVRTILSQPEKFEFSPDNPVEAKRIMDEVVVVPKVVRVEAYTRVCDHLQETLGYTRGKDLLEFAYDWRDDIRLSAQRLAETVDRWHPATPPVIIAHSMGCMVSRYYVDCLGGDRLVKKLILIAGPNYGFPLSMVTMLPDNLSRLHTFVTVLGGSMGQKIKQTFSSFPGLYQMFPIYPAVFDQHGQQLNLYEDGSWLPPDRQGLLAAGNAFYRDLNQQATIPTTCIFGYGSSTLTRLNIERDSQGKWQRLESVVTTEGDGVVASQSAILEGAEIHPVNQSHNQLYVDEDVLMRLKYELVGLT